MGKAANVSIVGGGIAGLAAAIALAGKGRNVTLYERAKKFEDIGAGLQLGPNAVRALQAIGAWETVEPITTAPPAIRIHNGRNGKLLKEIALGAAFERRYGQPYRVTHRADLHGALAALAKKTRNITMKLGREVDATTLKGDVIAADGVWSQTRTRLFEDSAALGVPEYIFRALVPLPKSGIGLDCVNLWMFPGGHVVHYPVGKKPRLNIVAVTGGQQPSQHFLGADETLRNIVALAPSWTEWPGAFVPPLPSWQKDNITLIGDAAHGTLPFLAQGAAMALEDVACLITSCDWAARQARVLRLHEETMKAGHAYHMEGATAFARDVVMSALPQEKFLQRLDWIYGLRG